MRNRQYGSTNIWIACILFAGSFWAQSASDILIADFEGPNYGAWQTEGTAFGKTPATGTLDNQMQVTGFEGKGLVNSFRGGDTSTGKLTSPEFIIERDFITFLIGGGGHKGKTCMNLLIDGEIVLSATGPNTEPGGSEFLNWKNWNVQKYKGKTAIIQIVDTASGGWGHINVDHISQSDTKAKQNPGPAPAESNPQNPHPEIVRTIRITEKYMIVPVSNQGQRARMTIRVDDQLVHNLDCDFPPNKESIDWWTYLDMSDYVGKTAQITAKAEPEIVAMVEASDEIRHLQPLYDEALRPQFHFSQMRGWNNDPNGMVYYDNQYHFFWQCNPAGRNWGNMYWGYATSPDMVHWTEQPRALRPFGGDETNRHPKMAVKNCFSGSGNIDLKNTAGWQTGDDKTMALAFTDTGCGESLAYSTDSGRTWTYYEGNPVIRHSGRDPKLIWYEPGNHWVIAVYDEDKEVGRNIAIYISRNLKEWELTSKIPGFFECAELFELPLDDDPLNTRWVLFAADAHYVVGQFNGKEFKPEHEGKRQVHWGNFYASQCFSNPPDGRVVQIGWGRGIELPGMPFNQTFTLPINLTLRTSDDGIRMFASPIKELEQLRRPEPKVIRMKELSTNSPGLELNVEGQSVDIEVTLKQGTAKKVILRFGENTATYDFTSQKLDEMPLKSTEGEVAVRVLVDRPMVELVGGGGACYKTQARRDMGQPLRTISLTAVGGTATVQSLTVWKMRSIWTR